MSFRPHLCAIATLSLVTVALLARPAIAQPPGVGFAVPAAVVPGKATDVTFFGGSLEGSHLLWTSFPGQVALTPDIPNNGNEGGKVTFRVTLPPEAPLGVGGVRIATGRGVSELRLLAIDDLPAIVENGTNKSPETAQEIALAQSVDGACEAESFDYFKFNATPGMRISVEVVARRIGSPLDPVIRLLNSAGHELAYSDDEPGIGADSRFRYEFTEAGTYMLELRDIRYQGSGGHRYHLRVGDFPFVTVPYPMGAVGGSTPRVGFAGPAIEGLEPMDVAAATMPAQFVTARWPQGRGGSWAELAVGSTPQIAEFEPNDKPENASPALISTMINGRFAVPRDRDYYQFDAKQGQRVLFIGRTRTLGSPTDLYMQLFNADGAKLAEADDSGTSEGVLDFTFPADGVYRLMAEDLLRRGGNEHAYQIEVQAYQPGFSLGAETDRFNAPQNGVFVGKITCGRRDYNGPITLAIEGGPGGIVLADNVIPEGKNETVLRATLPAGAAAGQFHLIKVVGSAKIGEANVTAVANNTGAVRGLLNGLPYPPLGLERAIALGVGPVFPDFFKLSTDVPVVTFPQLVGVANFKVKVEKLNGFDDPVAVAIEGLPAGFTAELKPIEKGKAETDVVIKGPATATEGRFPIRIVGSANFQNQPRSVVIDTVQLQIAPPLGVAAAVAGPLKAGTTQKVKVTLTRFGDQKPPVKLMFKNLPLGVSAPAELVIAEGQNELEFDLTAAPSAMIGPAANVTVSAAAPLLGREIVTASPPVALEVQMQ